MLGSHRTTGLLPPRYVGMLLFESLLFLGILMSWVSVSELRRQQHPGVPHGFQTGPYNSRSLPLWYMTHLDNLGVHMLRRGHRLYLGVLKDM